MASSLSTTIFKLCPPALVYLVISVIVLIFVIFSGGISPLTLFMKSALIVLWTFLLNWLCSRGLGVLSWIILLLPVVLVVLLASWSVDVQSRYVPSRSQTSLGNATTGCSSCREGLGNNAPAPAAMNAADMKQPAMAPMMAPAASAAK